MKYQEIKSLLTAIDDPVERLEMVMDFGRLLDDIPISAECVDISGCASAVKICRVGNKFYGQADSAMVRGIIAIIISMVDGCTPAQIKDMDLGYEFAKLSLGLGAGRMNGVNSIISFLENL